MENVMQKAPIELTLMGIDKKWVRGTSGQWRDKSVLALKKIRPDSIEVQAPTKKWWAFWKKA